MVLYVASIVETEMSAVWIILQSAFNLCIYMGYCSDIMTKPVF